MEYLALVAVLAIFFSGGNNHETSQDVEYKFPRAVLQNRFAHTRQEHCGEPDARRDSAVRDAMPQAHYGQ